MPLGGEHPWISGIRDIAEPMLVLICKVGQSVRVAAKPRPAASSRHELSNFRCRPNGCWSSMQWHYSPRWPTCLIGQRGESFKLVMTEPMP